MHLYKKNPTLRAKWDKEGWSAKACFCKHQQADAFLFSIVLTVAVRSPDLTAFWVREIPRLWRGLDDNSRTNLNAKSQLIR